METEIVKMETGELIEKTPEDLLLAAKDAAQALERVITLNDKPPLMFNGKRYLEYHHWQVLGSFYRVSVRSYEAEPCEIGGIQGFKAKADLVDSKSGAVVGGAEAYCMRDEPNWKAKPMYALASMAQTRAGSKSLSNRFRFVAIVAGYEGLGAEEVLDEMKGQPQVRMPVAKAPKPVQEIVPTTPMTEEEIKFANRPPSSKFFAQLHKVARERDVSSDRMRGLMMELFGKESSRDLLDHECAKLIKVIQGNTQEGT